ncbi:MAG: PIN domain-containing protein [Candidatus Bipolaricaulis sp.]|nr:PIN domain-containing protein [Candidatus Bipolaricaulis sp.]
MKVLFDTNVVLDVLLARKPYATAAAQLFALVERGEIQGTVCATTITTIHYLAVRAVGSKGAEKHLRQLLSLFEVAPVTGEVVASALDLGFADFEDAVVHEAACACGVSAIVTRNAKDFAKASVPVLSPVEFLAAVAAADA